MIEKNSGDYDDILHVGADITFIETTLANNSDIESAREQLLAKYAEEYGNNRINSHTDIENRLADILNSRNMALIERAYASLRLKQIEEANAGVQELSVQDALTRARLNVTVAENELTIEEAQQTLLDEANRVEDAMIWGKERDTWSYQQAFERRSEQLEESQNVEQLRVNLEIAKVKLDDTRSYANLRIRDGREDAVRIDNQSVNAVPSANSAEEQAKLRELERQRIQTHAMEYNRLVLQAQLVFERMRMSPIIQLYGFRSMGIIEANFVAMQTSMANYYAQLGMQHGFAMANAYRLGMEAALQEMQNNNVVMQGAKQSTMDQQKGKGNAPITTDSKVPVKEEPKSPTLEVSQKPEAKEPAPKPELEVKPMEVRKPEEARVYLISMDDLRTLKNAIKDWGKEKLHNLGVKLKPLIDRVKLVATNFMPNVAQAASIVAAGAEALSDIPEFKETTAPTKVVMQPKPKTNISDKGNSEVVNKPAQDSPKMTTIKVAPPSKQQPKTAAKPNPAIAPKEPVKEHQAEMKPDNISVRYNNVLNAHASARSARMVLESKGMKDSPKYAAALERENSYRQELTALSDVKIADRKLDALSPASKEVAEGRANETVSEQHARVTRNNEYYATAAAVRTLEQKGKTDHPKYNQMKAEAEVLKVQLTSIMDANRLGRVNAKYEAPKKEVTVEPVKVEEPTVRKTEPPKRSRASKAVVSKAVVNIGDAPDFDVIKDRLLAEKARAAYPEPTREAVTNRDPSNIVTNERFQELRAAQMRKDNAGARTAALLNAAKLAGNQVNTSQMFDHQPLESTGRGKGRGAA